MARLLLLFLFSVVAGCGGFFFFPAADAFQMPDPMAEAKGVRSDVKYIACEACEALAKHAAETVASLREAKKKEAATKAPPSSTLTSTPSSRFKRPPPAAGTLTEAEILDAVESMADPDADAGEWITHYDLIVKDSRLRLKDMGERGKCGARCRTIAMAAADALEGADTDLAERLWRKGEEGGREGDEQEELARWLCREATSACRGGKKAAGSPAPPLPAGYSLADAGVVFEPESAEDAQIRKMMAGMRAQGMGGQMFDRKSVLESLKEDEDDENDDDEEEGGGEDVGGGKKETAGGGGSGDADADKALEEEKEEQKKQKETVSSPPPPPPPPPPSAAEKAASVTGKGIAAARGWLSAKKESLLSAAAAASSAKKSTAEL